MIAMMAHPVDRFVSAFHQMFATSDRRGRMCGFLRCAPGSEFSRRYVAGNVTLDDAATWPRWESELAAGANWATKMLGLDGATLKDDGWKTAPLLARAAAGRAALARAKRRLAALDFVESSPASASRSTCSAALGLRLRYCACNVNPFARHAAAPAAATAARDGGGRRAPRSRPPRPPRRGARRRSPAAADAAAAGAPRGDALSSGARAGSRTERARRRALRLCARALRAAARGVAPPRGRGRARGDRARAPWAAARRARAAARHRGRAGRPSAAGRRAAAAGQAARRRRRGATRRARRLRRAPGLRAAQAPRVPLHVRARPARPCCAPGRAGGVTGTACWL